MSLLNKEHYSWSKDGRLNFMQAFYWYVRCRPYDEECLKALGDAKIITPPNYNSNQAYIKSYPYQNFKVLRNTLTPICKELGIDISLNTLQRSNVYRLKSSPSFYIIKDSKRWTINCSSSKINILDLFTQDLKYLEFPSLKEATSYLEAWVKYKKV